MLYRITTKFIIKDHRQAGSSSLLILCNKIEKHSNKGYQQLNQGKFVYRPSNPAGWCLYPDFCSMKHLGFFLHPHGWDASPSQDSLQY